MGKVYAILGVIGATILAIFVAFSKGAAAGRDKVVAKVTGKALKQQEKSTKVMVDGLKKENEVRDAKVDTTKRDRFTKQ